MKIAKEQEAMVNQPLLKLLSTIDEDTLSTYLKDDAELKELED